MEDFKLKPEIRREIRDIARSYEFTKIRFDTQIPWEGFRRTLACTSTPGDITYRYLFLFPATKFALIDYTLFQKSTRTLTLHERVHHLEPFNSNPSVNDLLVQRKACEEYGNPIEVMFLDVLTKQFPRIPFLKEAEIREEVLGDLNDYSWINENERNSVLEELSQKRNYKPRRLKRILRDRGIIPEHRFFH